MIERLADKLQDSLVDINLQSFITSQIKNDLARILSRSFIVRLHIKARMSIFVSTRLYIYPTVLPMMILLHDRKEQDKIIDMNFNIDRTGKYFVKNPKYYFFDSIVI